MISIPWHVPLSPTDLQALVDGSVIENRMLEYKRTIVMGAGASRPPEELLAGVSAMANTSGGTFLIGVSTDQAGIPVELTGIPAEQLDSFIGSIENVIRDGLEPRLPAATYRIEHVPVVNGCTVVAIRIRRSWHAPHRVRANRHYYGRNSNGKYQMDTTEIRSAYLNSEALPGAIHAFRRERLDEIQNESTPIPLRPGAKAVLHFVPHQAVLSADIIPPETCLDAGRRCHTPFKVDYLNMDGVLLYSSPADDQPAVRYTQIYRDCRIEDVICLGTAQGECQAIGEGRVEEWILRCIQSHIFFTRNVKMQPPFTVMLSLLDAACCHMQVDPQTAFFMEGSIHALGRDRAIFPDLLLPTEVDDDKLPRELKPLFDLFANAFGLQASPGFTETGEWRRYFNPK